MRPNLKCLQSKHVLFTDIILAMLCSFHLFSEVMYAYTFTNITPTGSEQPAARKFATTESTLLLLNIKCLQSKHVLFILIPL